MSTLLLMCFEFFKTGLFAVGGGLATIPFLYEISDKYGWFTHHEILNFIAVSESTPGPVGVNMATYAGYLTNGWYGAVLSTLSLILPSVLIVLIIASLLDKFQSNRFVQGAFQWLRPAATGLIAAAGLNVILVVFFDAEKITFDLFGKIGTILSQVNWTAVFLFAFLFLIMKTFKGHPLVFILISAGLGILLKL